MKSFGLEKESSGQTLFQFRTNFKSCFYDFGQKSCVLCRQHRFIVSKKWPPTIFSVPVEKYSGSSVLMAFGLIGPGFDSSLGTCEWLDEDRSTQTIKKKICMGAAPKI